MFSPIIDVGTSVVLKLHLTCIRRVNIPVFVIDLQQTRLSMQSVIDYPLKKTKFDDNYSINYTERPFTRPLYSACCLTLRSAGFQNYCFWSEEISQKTNNGTLVFYLFHYVVNYPAVDMHNTMAGLKFSKIYRCGFLS